jgi:uncharacterized delta-60 repeat protein
LSRKKLKMKMKSKNFMLHASALFILHCMFPYFVYSQAGANDPIFNTSDVSINKDLQGVMGSVFSSLSLSNGKILIGGSFKAYNGKSINGIARLNADGSLDAGFHSGLEPTDAINFMLLQPNNQLIIGGTFKKYGKTRVNQLARINTDGSLDTTFNASIGANGSIIKAVLEPQGKIIIIGNFSQYNNINKNGIARLNANGQLDATFNYTDTTKHEPTNLALQTNGKVIVTFTDNSEHDRLIVRLNANGSMDPSFTVENRHGAFNFISLHAIVIQPNGKIIIGGSIASGIESINAYCEVINADGSTDATFHPHTKSTVINHISIQSNGKIVLSGFYKNNSIEKPYSINTLERINADGSDDPTLNNYSVTEGIGFNNYTTSIQSDGKIILGGSFKYPQNGIARLNSDGGTDINFSNVTGANGRIKTMAIQANGKILIGGSFSSYNGAGCRRFTRINADGSLDTRFNNKLTAVVGSVNCIALQSDQKIILGGVFTLNNGTQFNNVVRLNADGSEDATFNTGNVILGNVLSINIQPDEKILVSGALDSYNGIPVKGVIRLNKNGTLDPAFVLDNTIKSNHVICKLQPDGKILIATDMELHRLNTDGSPDPSFQVNTSFEFIELIAIQNDGKIIIGGNHAVRNDRGFIVRLNGNGNVDSTFMNNRNLDRVASITLLSNNKIIVGRGESVYRLNADGTFDSAAELEGTGANALVWCSAENIDGKVILGGDFTTYCNVHRNGITRVLQSADVFRFSGTTSLTDPSRLLLRTYPDQVTSSLTIDNLISGSTVIILNALGQVVEKRVVTDRKTTIETSTYGNGVYFINAEYDGKTRNAKFTVNK